MVNIKEIISFLDSYLERSGRSELGAVEANRLLAKDGILRDSPTRPGLPLRNLLRAGLIPHAYQPSGKGGNWCIPHSPSISVAPVTSVSTAKEPETYVTRSPQNVERIREQIRQARERFKPKELKCLLIAEAPSDSIDRFFYFPEVKRADYLFLGVMKVLYPNLAARFLASGRSRELKERMLERFRADGFYLLDVLDTPLGLYKGSLQGAVPDLVKRVREVATPNIPIILIKANVFRVVFEPLRAAGFDNVISVEIPFPGQGWQNEFHAKFAVALKQAGFMQHG